MVQEIGIELLHAHPENSNRMDEATMAKLQRHIRRSGNYEPLVVRPHPTREGSCQVINGHHRMRVLRRLGCQTAKCIVWEVSDEQTRLYLATLNRLCGKDVPERRTMLLESLLPSFPADELASLLPEDLSRLEELERLARTELDMLGEQGSIGEDLPRQTVLFEFFLTEADAMQVNRALEHAICAAGGALSRSDALVCLANAYLGADRGACPSCDEKDRSVAGPNGT